VSCLLDMSSVLDMVRRVKGASLEGSRPLTPTPHALTNKIFRIDAAPGRF